ncbi:CDP-glycerol glycerophosphotransferase family protein [Dyadobacter sp. NIV53]|uniref:CDP-glycerol glycerophosphotransferase family protein n=1 Tax=Dyadobacter sp. NIV53 TaxID=2861765 RepID=UPI001C8820E8|nr:CDP-glycerol glycerophosphotransferase family protein [Dyadobacter sp. NIV53]
MIISWDNLTSKGIINADHDYVLAWNELMANEYRLFYSSFNAPDTQICVTGIPRFDIYFQKLPENYSISEFRKRYRIGASDKVILFTTSAINHFPNQADIVEHLLEYVSQKQDITVIVRCHAGDHSMFYTKFLQEPDLRIWHPDNTHNSYNISKRIPGLETPLSLAEMLIYCDVCLNVASTIRLEAAVCNKPGISIAYDGNLKPELTHSVQRFYAYSHQVPLNDLGIDHMVFSKNELFSSLDEILYKSSLPAINYTEGIEKFTCHSGPFGVSTSMKYIDQWLN